MTTEFLAATGPRYEVTPIPRPTQEELLASGPRGVKFRPAWEVVIGGIVIEGEPTIWTLTGEGDVPSEAARAALANAPNPAVAEAAYCIIAAPLLGKTA
jgi:hypothetical protein